MSDAKARFDRALADRKQERERIKKQKEGGGYKSFDPIEFVALQKDKVRIPQVLRVVSLPWANEIVHGDLVFQRDPWDAKPIRLSRITGDTGKSFTCYWPFPSTKEGKTWLLWRIYNKIMEKGKSEDPDVPNYVNRERYPDLFRQVRYNGKTADQPFFNYESGWKPGNAVALNVLDRRDPKWHKEYKHTKLISKKGSETSSGNFFYEPGVPMETFYKQLLLDEISSNHGNWQDYDIIALSLDDKPWYKAYHALHDRDKFADQPDVIECIVDGFLTEEEMSYEKWNLDKIYKITKYSTIKYHLGVFTEKVDKTLGTKFYEELLDLVETEKLSKSEDDEESEEPKVSIVVEKPVPSESVPRTTVPREPAKLKATDYDYDSPEGKELAIEGDIPWDKLADGTFNGLAYKGVPNLTPEEKAMVVGVYKNGLFKYMEKDPKGGRTIYESGDKKERTYFKSHEYLTRCPLTDQVFDSI